MKLVAAVCFAGLVPGCSLLLPPALECVDVPSANCQSAATAAESALFLQPGEVVERTVVRLTDVRSCMEDEMPVFDVDFYVRGNPRPLTITVAETAGGELVACTY